MPKTLRVNLSGDHVARLKELAQSQGVSMSALVIEHLTRLTNRPLVHEASLSDWDRPEEDAAWEHLQ
jgi:hypothetical protein